MRHQQQQFSTFLRIKRATTSSGGARRWLLYTVMFVLVVYIATATWFAISIVTTPKSPVIPGQQQQQQQQQQSQSTYSNAGILPDFKEPNPPSAEDNEKYTADDIHIVFSTGCNLFQHWQAEVVLYSHMKVGQKGKITRVVSGCDTEAEKRKHAKFLTHPEGLADDPVPLEELQKSSNPNFRLHVTPSFPGAKEFPWINKPMGLSHWLENANPPVNEKVIIVIDPDQFFLDRLVLDGSRSVEGSHKPYGKNGILMTAGSKGGQAFGRDVVGLTDYVKIGRPIAQTYGLGGSFVYTYNVSGIVEPGSPALKLDHKRAAQHYSVGPPMIVRIEDMRKIFSKWTKYMHPVFNQNPGDIQADMYAYSFAAAHFNLDHLMFDQYMVSSPMTGGEAWPFVNKFGKMSCSNPNKNARSPDALIPTFLHVAQRYDSDLTRFMFHKGHVPPNILSCDLPILITPPDDLIDTAPSAENRHKMYMLCNAYVLINEAVLAWKKKFCPPGYNIKKQIMLQKKGQHCHSKEQGKTCWVFARVEDEQKD